MSGKPNQGSCGAAEQREAVERDWPVAGSVGAGLTLVTVDKILENIHKSR